VHILLQNQEIHLCNKLAIEKSGVNTEVAINVISKFDEFVKENLKSGESYWMPFEKAFEKQIQDLKK